ncbi:hypothetical protein JW826_02625 [Candidatus Woesearchaeota archaeon]|nr:hypothetical protein [Candidatus Woesearchaeota archaeon]
MRSKKGMDALQMIGAAVIMIAILLITIYLVMKVPGWVGAASKCEPDGICTSEGACPSDHYRRYGAECSPKTDICCVSDTKDKVAELRFNTAQRKAIAEPIFVTIGKDSTKVTALNFKEGEKYDIHVAVNKNLPEDAFGPVLIYLKNSKRIGETYVFKVQGEGTGSIALVADGNDISIISSAFENKKPLDGPTQDLKYEASLADSYNKYTMKVIILDKMKMICKSLVNDEEKWLNCLRGKDTQFPPTTPLTHDINEIKSYATDPGFQVAARNYALNVQRILDIQGVGSNWALDDTITITSTDPEFGDVQLSLVNGQELTTPGFDAVVEQCTSESQSSKFIEKVRNVVGTTIESSGLPLDFNIGGFRIPTSTTPRMKYYVDEKKVTMAKGKADVKIDYAVMYDMYTGKHQPTILAGESAFLCVKAKTKDNKVAYAVSDAPLKIDVLEPGVTNDDVHVIPAEPVQAGLDTYWSRYPSYQGKSPIYLDYTRVYVTCQDYGQSGCASYDYYLKTGNFINVNVNTNSTGEALTGIGIQFALNSLMQYFASKTAETTICPSIYTNEYRPNSNPDIRIKVEGQGIICIRVKDKVGNMKLIWGPVYTPAEVIQRTIQQEADRAAAAAEAALNQPTTS